MMSTNHPGDPVMLPAPATLVDPSSGLAEELGYLTGPSDPLFAVLHRPAAPGTVAVVVAPPFLMEFQRNYRREVLLGRALAAAGIPALRFSYRGQGHSAGSPRDLGYEQAVADTVAAVGHARERTGIDRVVIVGTRLATIVAAAAAVESDVRHIVGWDPIVQGSAWVRELARAAKVQAMRDDDAAPGSLAEQLAERGETEVLGSSLYPSLHDGLDEVALAEPAAGLSAMLLVQFGRPDKIKKALSTLADAMSGVTIAGVSEEESWWATRRADYFQAETERPLTRELIPMTVDWIRENAT
jgi:alpha/beta superfamily hydrolase